jgi:para-nitrobenzyl esterase
MYRRIAEIASALSLCCAAVSTTQAKHNELIIKTESGLVEGTHSVDYPNVIFFFGIPYAAPPVGALRWKPPQPPARWHGVRKADELSAACPQSDDIFKLRQRILAQIGGDPSKLRPYDKKSEDCLYLNVMTTHPGSSERRPVMVFIHGGSGVVGRGDDGGAALAAAGAVVVTFNYRLGILGWLAHPALTDESAQHSSGNYGLLDQIAVLQWVRRNIAQFGGDPENVTLFGVSSGGEYVGCLMISPLAHGFFQRAIMQSGVPLDLHPSIHHPGGEVQAAEEPGVKLAHSLEAGDGPDALKRLRLIPADELVGESLPYDISVDGWVIPDQPLAMFARGQQGDIPVMVGSTEREFSNLILLFPDHSSEGFRTQVRRSFPSIADDVLRIYPAPASGDATESFVRAETELRMIGPARWLAGAMLKKRSKAYLYNLTWAFSSKGGQELGAFHSIDIVLLFHIPGVPWDKSADALAQVMRRYWVQFAAKGDPNASGLANWPAYDSATGSYLELGMQTRRAGALHEDAFQLINRLYRTRLTALTP